MSGSCGEKHPVKMTIKLFGSGKTWRRVSNRRTASVKTTEVYWRKCKHTRQSRLLLARRLKPVTDFAFQGERDTYGASLLRRGWQQSRRQFRCNGCLQKPSQTEHRQSEKQHPFAKEIWIIDLAAQLRRHPYLLQRCPFLLVKPPFRGGLVQRVPQMP